MCQGVTGNPNKGKGGRGVKGRRGSRGMGKIGGWCLCECKDIHQVLETIVPKFGKIEILSIWFKPSVQIKASKQSVECFPSAQEAAGPGSSS